MLGAAHVRVARVAAGVARDRAQALGCPPSRTSFTSVHARLSAAGPEVVRIPRHHVARRCSRRRSRCTRCRRRPRAARRERAAPRRSRRRASAGTNCPCARAHLSKNSPMSATRSLTTGRLRAARSRASPSRPPCRRACGRSSAACRSPSSRTSRTCRRGRRSGRRAWDRGGAGCASRRRAPSGSGGAAPRTPERRLGAAAPDRDFHALSYSRVSTNSRWPSASAAVSRPLAVRNMQSSSASPAWSGVHLLAQQAGDVDVDVLAHGAHRARVGAQLDHRQDRVADDVALARWGRSAPRSPRPRTASPSRPRPTTSP